MAKISKISHPKMTVYAIIRQDIHTEKILREKFNMERFSIFTAGTVKNFIRSICKDIAKRLPKDAELREIREKMNQDTNIKIIIQVKAENRIFVITDGDYNSSVAYKLMGKCFESNNYDGLINEYKNWETKDQLKKIEGELEKCNAIVLEGLSNILERGESLSDLVAKSENLSLQTKILFKAAKKKNSCC